jgi:hypothetical protein
MSALAAALPERSSAGLTGVFVWALSPSVTLILVELSVLPESDSDDALFLSGLVFFFPVPERDDTLEAWDEFFLPVEEARVLRFALWPAALEDEFSSSLILILIDSDINSEEIIYTQI